MPDGTSCGTNQVCGGGACNACIQGSECLPEPPCRTGAVHCASGYPECVVTGDAPDGSPCGNAGTCAGGVCG